MQSHPVRSTLALCCGIACVAPSYARAATESDSQEKRQLTAEAIAEAVEDELYADTVVSLDDVRASVRSGTVRLEGSVPSLLAKHRATLIAEAVKGVRNVDDALVVEPKRELDIDELERRVRHAILTEPSTELFQINVTAIPPGEVTIEGAVDSLVEKDMVERAVRGVSGVTAVRNDIRVDYKAMRADRELALDVEALLRWDAYVDAGLVNVAVRDGVATLSGTVGSAAEKRRARSLALSTGIRDVDVGALEVSRWARDDDLKDAYDAASDVEVQRAVLRALRNSVSAPTELLVDADDGVITLRGQVPSLGTKRAAAQAARSVAAVHTVRNRLRVADDAEGLEPLTDNDIEQRIKDALVTNPLTEAFEIQIDVRRGIAKLTGRVDSWQERGAAEEIAARMRGVHEVDNDLEVTNTRERITFDPYVDGWSVYHQNWYDPGPATSRWRDAAIETAVRDQFWWSPFVDETEVDVSVEGGVVTLTGTVDSRAERAAARENALEGGAISVVNNLAVAAK